MARPTKYNEDIQKRADDYVVNCGNEFWNFEKTIGEKSNTYERKVKIKLPTNEGLGLHLDVADSTIYLWAEKHEMFSETLEKIKRLQKKMLIEHSLNGDYSPVIAKLMLSSNHGMREKVDTDITSKGEQLKTVINIIKPHE